MPEIHLTGCRLCRVIEFVNVPAVMGDFPDGVHALVEQLPEFFGIVRASGKTTPNADDGYRFVF